VASLVYKHLNEPAPLVSTSRPDLAPQIDVLKIDAVIKRAMAKRPADRADALEMTEALRDAMGEADGAVAERAIVAVEIYNPYKGLRAFEDADADDFFGREALVEQLVGRQSDSRGFCIKPDKGQFR
jgi:hypothetical protein